MAIIKSIIYRAQCDNCGDLFTENEYDDIDPMITVNKYHIIDLLRDRKWTVGKNIICPECQKGEKNE